VTEERLRTWNLPRKANQALGRSFPAHAYGLRVEEAANPVEWAGVPVGVVAAARPSFFRKKHKKKNIFLNF